LCTTRINFIFQHKIRAIFSRKSVDGFWNFWEAYNPKNQKEY
jgi:hypothetical protein